MANKKVNKVGKEFDKVVDEMKKLAPKFAKADGAERDKILKKLKELTAKKKDLKAEIERSVMDAEKDIDLQIEIKSMIKSILIFSILVLVGTCTGNAQVSDSQPVSHEKWDILVKQYVNKEGNVDYQGFVDAEEQLQEYLDLLSSHHPNTTNWNREQRLAYWINAYNAFTVKLIVDNYPVESIRDIKKGLPMINSVWDIKFIEIEGEKYDLNNIEHDVLRKEFDEPRIHFAINCASVSCPVLRNEAYSAHNIDQQLAEQTSLFLSDASKNIISQDKLQLSKIFSWFKGDFTQNGSLTDFIDSNTSLDINNDAEVSFLDYDWSLNGN